MPNLFFDLAQRIYTVSGELSSFLKDPTLTFTANTAQEKLEQIRFRLREHFREANDVFRCVLNLDSSAFKNLLILMSVLNPHLTRLDFCNNIGVYPDCYFTDIPLFLQSNAHYLERFQKNRNMLEELIKAGTLFDEGLDIDFRTFAEGSHTLQAMVQNLMDEQSQFYVSNEEKYTRIGVEKIAIRQEILQKHLATNIKPFFQKLEENQKQYGCVYLLLLEKEYFSAFIKNFFNIDHLSKELELAFKPLKLYPTSPALREATVNEQNTIAENSNSLSHGGNFRNPLETLPLVNDLIDEALGIDTVLSIGGAFGNKSLQQKPEELIFFKMRNQLQTVSPISTRVTYLLTANKENLKKLCAYFSSPNHFSQVLGFAKDFYQLLKNAQTEENKDKIAIIEGKQHYYKLLSHKQYDLKSFSGLNRRAIIHQTLSDNLSAIGTRKAANIKLCYLGAGIPPNVRDVIVNDTEYPDAQALLNKLNQKITLQQLKKWTDKHPECYLSKSPFPTKETVDPIINASNHSPALNSPIINCAIPLYSDESEKTLNKDYKLSELLENSQNSNTDMIKKHEPPQTTDNDSLFQIFESCPSSPHNSFYPLDFPPIDRFIPPYYPGDDEERLTRHTTTSLNLDLSFFSSTNLSQNTLSSDVNNDANRPANANQPTNHNDSAEEEGLLIKKLKTS